MVISVSAAEGEDTVESLKIRADRLMIARDVRGASKLFERALALEPRRVDIWVGLAACRRAAGEPQDALTAVEGALAADPRCFSALLMKGSLLETLGQEKAAAASYRNALLCAPNEDALGEPMRRALARAREVQGRYAADLVAALRAEAGLAGGAPTSAASRRLETFIEAMAGRRRIYHQEPVSFHYPGLPAIEFFERDAFPWLEALEERTDAIRQELLAVWTEGSPELTPYVNYRDGVPLDQWSELNRSLNWSAYHLHLDGAPVKAHCRDCPETMAALALAQQPRITGRSPSAMFSILKPRTRIPPHTGVANTRLVVHLPLVVPEGCGFRVGGETRAWREGEAWVFDDTIEHEAWNTSDHPRVVLIFDVWNPLLPPAERDLVVRLTAAMDRFNATGGGG